MQIVKKKSLDGSHVIIIVFENLIADLLDQKKGSSAQTTE